MGARSTGMLLLTTLALPLAGCEWAPEATSNTGITPVEPTDTLTETVPVDDDFNQTEADIAAFLHRRDGDPSPEADAIEPPRRRPPGPAIDWQVAGGGEEVAEPETPSTSPAVVITDPPAEPVEVELPLTEDTPSALRHDRLGTMIVDLSRELWEDARLADMPLRQLLLIAATSMVRPDRALDADAVEGLTDRERELLGLLQQFFVELGNELAGERDADVVIDEAVGRLGTALSTVPELTLPQVCLATRVRGFGDYDQFGRNENGSYVFLAHSGRQVIVYIEIEDFTSTVESDTWITNISQRLVIYADPTGMPVWREEWQTATDRTRNQRHDFFTVQVITLPPELGVGRYQLKVQVRDELSGAESETGMTFEMVADRNLLP